MKSTKSASRWRFLCAFIGHRFRVHKTTGKIDTPPTGYGLVVRLFGLPPAIPGALVGCRRCGAIWDDQPEQVVTPMRAIGECRACKQHVLKSTKDGRIFAGCACVKRAGWNKLEKLMPIVNGRPHS